MLRTLFKTKDVRTMASNYGALLIIQGANFILPLITLPYLVRILGAENFGLIMFAQAFCTIIYVFVDFGFSLSATRRISLAKGDTLETSKLFFSVIAVKLILAVLVFILFTILIFSVQRFSDNVWVYIFSYGVILGQALFPDWFFQGIERMKIITIVNLVTKSIFAASIFLFITEQDDFIRYPILNSTAYIIGGVISFSIALKHTVVTVPSFARMKEIVIESKNLFISNFSARLFNSANVFILGLLAGDYYAGIYASMEKIIVALKSFFSPLYQAIYPWLSKQRLMHQRKTIRRIFPFMLIISACFTLGALFLGSWILELLFDDPKITNQSLVFKILSFSAIFSTLNMLYLSLYFPAVKAYKTRMKLMVYGGLINLCLLFSLIPTLSLYGAALAVVITELSLLIFSRYSFYKNALA